MPRRRPLHLPQMILNRRHRHRNAPLYCLERLHDVEYFEHALTVYQCNVLYYRRRVLTSALSVWISVWKFVLVDPSGPIQCWIIVAPTTIQSLAPLNDHSNSILVRLRNSGAYDAF